MGRHTSTAPASNEMGRRKIDIAYLPDDRVRKVTFCKRKGGLFKKADDLSKLCGVEVAVLIVSDTKTCEYASTDVSRILQRYQALRAGDNASSDTSETQKLWTRLETQRRELESLTRELAEERRKVEDLRQFVPSSAVQHRPVDMLELPPMGLPTAASQAQIMQQLHVGVQPQRVSPPAVGMLLAQPVPPMQPVVHAGYCAQNNLTARDAAPALVGLVPRAHVDGTHEADTEGSTMMAAAYEEGDGDASDDTAEAESLSEDMEEPAPKRARVDNAVHIDSLCAQQVGGFDECDRSEEVAAPISAAMAASVVAEMQAPAVHIV